VPPAPRLSPSAAFDLLTDDDAAVLIDVRTPAEWRFVGGPDLAAMRGTVLQIPWQDVDGRPNPAFVAQVRAAGVDEDQPVLFLCRSGGRSQAAADAAMDEGFAHAVNVDDGFEGPADEHGHRGSLAGWKVAGLPWRQG
jgi:rhodanese-related sulfurtransferase